MNFGDMNVPSFLAKRIYGKGGNNKKLPAPSFTGSSFVQRKDTKSDSPNDMNIWSTSGIGSKRESDNKNENDCFDKDFAPLKERNENCGSSKRKDYGNVGTSKDMKKSKDLRSLLVAANNEDIEFLRKSVQENINKTELNEFFVTIPANWTAQRIRRIKDLMQNEYLGFKEYFYGENTFMKISVPDLDKLKRTLKSLESDGEDNVKVEQTINASIDHNSLKDSSEWNETSSEHSKSRSSSIVETSDFTDRRPPPIFTTDNSESHTHTQRLVSDRRSSFSNPSTSSHATEIRRFRRCNSVDQTSGVTFDFTLQVPVTDGTSNPALSSYSNFPPRPDVSRTHSVDDLSWIPCTPNDDAVSPRSSPRTVRDGVESIRNTQSPSISILNETLAKTHLQSLQTMNGGFVSIDLPDLPLNRIQIDEDLTHCEDNVNTFQESKVESKIDATNSSDQIILDLSRVSSSEAESEGNTINEMDMSPPLLNNVAFASKKNATDNSSNQVSQTPEDWHNSSIHNDSNKEESNFMSTRANILNDSGISSNADTSADGISAYDSNCIRTCSFLDDYSPVPSFRLTTSNCPLPLSTVKPVPTTAAAESVTGSNTAFNRNFPVTIKKTLRRSKSETFSNNRVCASLITPGGPGISHSQPSPNKGTFETPQPIPRMNNTGNWGSSTEARAGLLNMLISMYKYLEPNEDWTIMSSSETKLPPDTVMSANIKNVQESLSAKRNSSTSAFELVARPSACDDSVLPSSTSSIHHEGSERNKSAKMALSQRIMQNTNKQIKTVQFSSPSRNPNQEAGIAFPLNHTKGSSPLAQEAMATHTTAEGIQHTTEGVALAVDGSSSSPSSPHQSGLKRNKDAAKWRRMTMAHSRAKADMSMDASGIMSPTSLHRLHTSSANNHDSPTVVSKLSQKAFRKRQSMLHSKAMDLSTLSTDHATHISRDNTPEINENNFKGIVIGGTYQQCFDNDMPVISMPLANEKRLIDARVCADGSALLKLYIPKDETVREIRFPKGWHIIRANPDGFLISKDALCASKRVICYYLAKYPAHEHDNLEESACTEMEVTSQGVFTTSSAAAVATMTEDDAQSELILNIPSTDWNNSVIVSVILSYLPFDLLRQQSVMTVSKSWAIAYCRVAARFMSECHSPPFEYPAWSKFVHNNPWGKFLSSGACKDVYCVQSMKSQVYAVSVSDVDDLAERDMEELIQKELEISMLCSSLVTLKVCPNFVLIHSTFQSKYPAPAEKFLGGKQNLWDKKFPIPSVPNSLLSSDIPTAKQLNKAIGSNGNFQFIKMEFCCGGDLEEYIRGIKVPSIDVTRNLLFQMCFSLYCAREQLSLRHFDLKLLNFFVTNGSVLLPPTTATSSGGGGGDVHVRIGFEKNIYEVRIPSNTPELVKLADYGTGEITNMTLNDYITVQQFTTLENTPPEYLLIGSAARQAYSADTFCLGLSYLHLLTGNAPYEELLADVKCPAYLMDRLMLLWETNDVCSDYFIIREVIDSLDDSEEDANIKNSVDSCKKVLYHTIYRYLVLFGVSADLKTNENNDSKSPCVHNPVWDVLVDALGLLDDDNKFVSKRTPRAMCRNQYAHDSSLWSVKYGTQEIMRSVRERLTNLGGSAEAMLFSMVHLDPSKRCSMYDVLKSSLFDPLKAAPAGHSLDGFNQRQLQQEGRKGSKRNGSINNYSSIDYMHYYTNNEFAYISRV